MTSSSSTISRFAIRGVTEGVMLMAIFSTVWAGIGIGGLQGWGGIWPVIVVVLIGATLFVGAITLSRTARSIPAQTVDENGERGKQVGRWFMIVFITEMVLIMITSFVCVALRRFDLLFPVTALIVGAHFFPLASLFRLAAYHLVGAALCLLGLLALFVIPTSSRIGDHPINAQWVVLGFGAAFVLWCVGAGLWILGKRLLALPVANKM